MAPALAASLAVHAALLAVFGPLAFQPPAADRLPAALEVSLRSLEAVVPSAAAQTRKPPARPLLSGRGYYEAGELERRPQIASHVAPAFPDLALAPTGEVVLALYVNERGGVDRVVVERDDRNGAFAASARQAFAGARFLPALRGGRPVKAVVRVEVLFGSPHPDNAVRSP